MLESADNAQIRVCLGGILAHQGHPDLIPNTVHCPHKLLPLSLHCSIQRIVRRAGISQQGQTVRQQRVEALVQQQRRHVEDIGHVRDGQNALHGHVAEECNLLAVRSLHWATGSTHDEVGR